MSTVAGCSTFAENAHGNLSERIILAAYLVDFREIKQLRANTVRVHLQLAQWLKYFQSQSPPHREANTR
jgi:hypothetical protein